MITITIPLRLNRIVLAQVKKRTYIKSIGRITQKIPFNLRMDRSFFFTEKVG